MRERSAARRCVGRYFGVRHRLLGATVVDDERGGNVGVHNVLPERVQDELIIVRIGAVARPAALRVRDSNDAVDFAEDSAGVRGGGGAGGAGEGPGQSLERAKGSSGRRAWVAGSLAGAATWLGDDAPRSAGVAAWAGAFATGGLAGLAWGVDPRGIVAVAAVVLAAVAGRVRLRPVPRGASYVAAVLVGSVLGRSLERAWALAGSWGDRCWHQRRLESLVLEESVVEAVL